MADYSTDNLKQSQQFLQAYDKLYSFKNTFYDLLASLEKTLGLTEYLSHISVIQLRNEKHFQAAFHYPNEALSQQQSLLSHKAHLIAKKLKLKSEINCKDFSHILTECGYNDNIRPTTVYPLRFDDYLYGFAALELNEKAINFQQFSTDSLTAVVNILCAYFIKKHAFEQTALQQKVYTSIINGMNNLIYVTDIHTNKILFMNQTMKDRFALKAPEGKICWQVLQQNMSQRCNFCPVSKLLRDPSSNKTIHWEEVNSKTGRIYENHDSLINWFDGSIVHLQQSIDITDSKKAFHDACFDELTNTLTRRAGKELLEKLIKAAHQNCHGFITCMFDINSLKQVNDNYGHSEGDKLIITICQTVKKYLGSGDIFFRLSGDEFIVIFTEHSLQNVKEILQKVLIELKNSAQKNALPYEPSFTYGLLEVQPTSNYSLTDILNRVDEKMYEQKRSYHILKRQQDAGLQKQSDPSEKNSFSYQAEYLYDALVNSTDDYLYVCDVQSDVFHYPKTMVEEFALPGEYIKNAAAIWGAKVHPDDQSAFLASNQEILDGRANIHYVEYRAQNKEGKWIWVRCRGQMQYNEQGEAILFAGFIKKLGENYKQQLP